MIGRASIIGTTISKVNKKTLIIYVIIAVLKWEILLLSFASSKDLLHKIVE